MKPGRPHVRVSLVALLAAATLCALLFVNATTLEGIRASRPRVAHHRETQAALSRIRAALVDAETGQRGFLLTGDAKYLEPFKAATESLPATLGDLKRLAADDPSLRQESAEVERLASRKIDEIRTTVELAERGQALAAMAIVRGDEGKTLMDDARRVIDEMRAQEDAKLEERTSAMRRSFDRATWIDAGAGLGLFALGFILFAMHRDIARREELEKALRDEARFQQQFIGILSHDLRNPLGAITMMANKIERSVGSQPESARRILSSTARMTRMIHQLLDLTRARLGSGIPIDPKAGTNLSEVVTGAVEELLTVHPGANVKVEADDAVSGSWDPDRVSQLVSNLVTNAILHGEGAIVVRVAQADGSALLEVHNGGAPIPPDVQPRVFEPFHSAARHGEAGSRGLGLGLFIAERIVVAHGGRIDVRSTEREGTTFTVGLPFGS